jgi:hypothetical protein
MVSLLSAALLSSLQCQVLGLQKHFQIVPSYAAGKITKSNIINQQMIGEQDHNNHD